MCLFPVSFLALHRCTAGNPVRGYAESWEGVKPPAQLARWWANGFGVEAEPLITRMRTGTSDELKRI